MEQGMECKIPDELLSARLPQSFQYYDAIIHITQNLVTQEKREFLNMQTNLIRYFDTQYSLWNILGSKSKNKKKKQQQY